ncbi:hypothetical protein Q4E93_00765 [Flavitalea sp. BT771]|uniref:hypothetical protein n=1 Tax=Flavitalea sp. BT771 TaxID=3063329 RepID=UPI0026E3A3D9|nr:hypothetical protein [Flavitalea sp. BT771]MDO6429096.1 hypothetical protein [Flavitalea sp. BT771]MDV6218776.1 hypothetical protein [Flavitalea sp. BT771]
MIIDFLEEQRKKYLDAVELAGNRLAAQGKFEGFKDVLDQKKFPPGELNDAFQFFRHDILVRDAGGSYLDLTVNVDPVVFNEPMVFREADSDIVLHSFVWNACEISGVDVKKHLAILRHWRNKWLKEEIEGLNEGFVNAIHGADVGPDANSFIVDFGSCIASGVKELFSDLIGSDAKLILRAGYI